MTRRRFLLRAASLAAICATASALATSDLFARQSSCAPKFDQCRHEDFPDYFCCPSGQTCIALAGNTTLLCCPDGANCERIAPLPCDISLQDGEKNPDAVVKTTALGGTLGRCGDQCCPFGYSCAGGSQCIMDRNQNAVPFQTNTARPGPTSTASATTSATTSAPSEATGPAESPSTTSGSSDEATSRPSGGPPVGAIVGGVIGGVVVLIGAAVLALVFLRKKNSSQSSNPPKLTRSTSSFGNFISNPIVSEDTTLRSDFARVQGPRDPGDDPGSVTADVIGSPESGGTLSVPPAAARPTAAAARQSSVAYGYGGGHEPSPFVDMPDMPDMSYGYDDDHGGGLMPQTPRQQQREPSSVSINVFADPNITPDRTPEQNTDRRYSNLTTFTQMLNTADLGGFARGESFVPYHPDGGHGGQMPGR
ncbi:hypothetical protein VTK56DRAFT_1752 [Thermocarpiscus australiensis]